MFSDYYTPYGYLTPREYELLRQRQRQEQEYGRRLAYEREMARRLAEDEERRRRLERERLLEEERRRRAMLEERKRHNQPKYVYRVVRGMDGRLYRVPFLLNDEEEETEEVATPTKPTVRTRDVPSKPQPQEEAPATRKKSTKEPGKKAVSSDRISVKLEAPKESQDENEKITISIPKDTKHKKNKPRRRKVTIVVEDASDSEYEDDELHSVWRNRRPSPGQWMEPIE